MYSGNDYGALDAEVARFVEGKASQLVRQGVVNESDRQDVEQDLAVEVIRRAERYDPARGPRNAYDKHIIKNAVATLIERKWAAKRDPRREAGSLDRPVQGPDGEGTSRSELFPADGDHRRPSSSQGPDLAHDVNAAQKGLDLDLCSLAEKLKTKSVSEVARETGRPRGTIYEDIKKIRKHFEREGLRDYL